MLVITHYKKLHGAREGRVCVFYDDGLVHGTLYGDNFTELYKAARFLTMRSLDRKEITAILEDKHGLKRGVQR